MDLLEDNQRLREERDLLRRRLTALEEDFSRSNREVFEMNEALVQANARLSELDRLKDTFLSLITHELRTPMTAMMGLAENLEAGVYGPLNETQTETLHKIIESGGRLRQLVNDLLDLSKMESGMMRLQREPLDPRALVEAVLYQLASLAEAGAVKLINRVGYDLPEVDCDGQRVEQVLTNLISNALKFTPPEGSVTVTAVAQEAFVVFRVTDTGCGIPKESQAHIFDKFIQLHPNRDDRTKGTGLGLTIVRHLVELHGGSVGIESEVGQGSRFSFSLPVFQS